MAGDEMTTDERAAWAAWEPTDEQRSMLRLGGERLRPIFLAGFRAAWNRRAPADVNARLLAAAKTASDRYHHMVFEEWLMDSGMDELDAAIADAERADPPCPAPE